MRSTLALIAITGLAASAPAGDEAFSLTMEGPTFIDGTGPVTITIDVIGDSSFGTHLFGGQFGLSSSGHPEVSDIRWVPEEWSTLNELGEYDGNGNLNDVIYGQFIVFTDLFDFLPGDNSELGSRIGQFQVDFDNGFQSGFIEFSFITDPDRFALKAIDVDDKSRTTHSLDSNHGDLSLNGLTIIVPSPSVMTLLGFGGLVFMKRRRSSGPATL